jgi:hypothetical protein
MPMLRGVPAPLHPAADLSRCARLIVEAMCRAVAERAARDVAGHALLVLLWARLRRLAGRLARAAARVAAGAPSARPRPADGAAASADPPPPCPRTPDKLPRSLRALARLVPEAACYGGQLRQLLARPEIADLLAEAPHLGRYIRPLCRLLGIDPAAAGPAPIRPLPRRAPRAASAGPPRRPRASLLPGLSLPKPA